MGWKNYSNPLYDVVEDPEAWTSGLCCLFANAINERFGLPMQALVVESEHDGNQLLVHAFARLPDGRIVDSIGVRSEAKMMAAYEDCTESDWRSMACLDGAPYDKAGIKTHVRDVKLGDLWSLNPEDHEATNAAHSFIDEHKRRFAVLHAMERSSAAKAASTKFVKALAP